MITEVIVSTACFGALSALTWGIKWPWAMRLHAEDTFEGTLRERLPLQKSKVLKKTIGSIIGVFFGVGLLGAVLFGLTSSKSEITAINTEPLRSWIRGGWVGWFVVSLCTTPLQWVLYFRRYYYDADAQNITIRKGIITQKEVTLPFSQITDVYLDQDIIDVVLGLYDVHISTATQESGQQAHIDGVCKKDALLLKELILKGINK